MILNKWRWTSDRWCTQAINFTRSSLTVSSYITPQHAYKSTNSNRDIIKLLFANTINDPATLLGFPFGVHIDFTHIIKNYCLLQSRTRLLCFYFYPLCYAAVLLKSTYYAQECIWELWSDHHAFDMQFCMNNSLHVADNCNFIKTVLLECINERYQSIPLCSIIRWLFY